MPSLGTEKDPDSNLRRMISISTMIAARSRTVVYQMAEGSPRMLYDMGTMKSVYRSNAASLTVITARS